MIATKTVNEQTVVHKDSEGVCISCDPDVCLTPPGIPVAYTNVAFSRDLADGSISVFVDDNPIALKESIFATSYGDEPGTMGGVISGVNKGKARFTTYSMDVKVEGRNVARQYDSMSMNGNQDNVRKGQHWQPGQRSPDKDCSQFLPPQAGYKFLKGVRRWGNAGKDGEAFFKTMRPYLNKLARDLKLKDSRFLYAHAAKESGWMDPENTQLNNPFGVCDSDKQNLGFENMPQAIAYWKCMYEDYLRGAQTIDDYVKGLKAANYNPNPYYYSLDRAPDPYISWNPMLRTIDTWAKNYGYGWDNSSGVNLLEPLKK